MKLNVHKDKQEVAKVFSSYLANFVKDKEIVHIALSGGSTPKIVFDELAADFSDEMDWGKIHLYWGDERCVKPTDDDSNYRMTVEHLLSKIEMPKENIHRVLGENAPAGEAMRYANLLEINLDRVAGVPSFDLVILGMGDDGHTASIFPHEIALWNATDHCVVATHPDSGQKRISINGAVINNAKTVAFLVTGADKADKVAEILGQKKDYTTYPASLVAPVSKDLIWFLDKDAASKTE